MSEKTNRMSGHERQAVGAATGDEETKRPPPGELHASKIRARSEVVR
jgi:uncharacterized protein YjbJ (UPF0337 family)